MQDSIDFEIYRNDIIICQFSKDTDYLITFLKSFETDDAVYEIFGFKDKLCVIDLYGNIPRILKCLNADIRYNI